MAAGNVEIRVTATGAEAAARVLAAIAKEGGAIGSIVSPAVKKAEDALARFTATAKQAGETLESVGKKMSLSITAPIAAFATAISAAGIAVDDAMDRIRAGTGATGDALGKLGADFRAVLSEATATSAQVSGALVKVNKALDLDGQPLRDMTTLLLNFARITETDVNAVIEASIKVFNNWGVAVEDQAGSLDFLNKASQATGTNVLRLMEGMTTAGPILRTFGIGFEHAAAIISQMERAGLDSTSALAGMRKSLQELKDRGVTDTAAGLAQLVAEIKNSKNEAEAGAKAFDLFGGRGFAFGEAIFKGKLNVDEFVKTLRNTPETINKAAAETLSFGDKLQILKNKLTLAADTMGTPFLTILEERLLPVVIQVTDGIGKVGAALASLPPSVQFVIVSAVAVVAALGPLLAVIGIIVKTVPLAIAGFGGLTVAFTALTGGTGLIIIAVAALAVGVGILAAKMLALRSATEQAREEMALFGKLEGLQAGLGAFSVQLQKTIDTAIDPEKQKAAQAMLDKLKGIAAAGQLPPGQQMIEGQTVKITGFGVEKPKPATDTDASGAAATLAALRGQADVAASAIEAAAARATIAVKDAVAQRVMLAEDAAVKEAQITANAAQQQLASYQAILGGFKGKLEERAAITAKISDLTVKSEQAASGVRLALRAREDESLKVFVDRLNTDVDDALQGVTQSLDHYSMELRETAEAQARFADGMDVLMGGLDGAADAFDQIAAAARGELVASLGAAEKELSALKETLGQTGPAADVLREFLAKTGLSVTDLDERTKNFLVTLGKTRAELANTKSAEAFGESIAAISRESALVGRDFDLASANLGAFQRRILELQAIKNPTGEILTEIDQLKAKFADTSTFIAWRTTFTDVFSSFGSAFSTSVKGVVMGTQTIDEAFKNLGQSILLTLLDTVINKGLKVLTDALWDFVAGMFSGGSAGGGIIGAILTGAGALAAKLFSSSPSGIGPGTATDPTGTELDAVKTSASGAATALDKVVPGVTNFSAAVSAGLSALGVGLGIFGLAKGGSAGSMALSAGGTALSAYSLIQSVSVLAKSAGLISTALPTIGSLVASGLVAIAPQFAAGMAVALGNIAPALAATLTTALVNAGVVAGPLAGGATAAGAGAAAAGATSFGSAIAGAAGASFLAFVGFMVSGGFAGKAQDAEDAAESFGQQLASVRYALDEGGKAGLLFADLGKQLDSSHLVGTLHTLHDAIRDLGDLDLATGLNQVLGDEGAASITAAIPMMRATVGAAWIAALDAAFTQGLDLSPGGTNAPNLLRETLQAPNRLTPKGDLSADSAVHFQDLLGYMDAGVDSTEQAIGILSHLLEITRTQAGALVPAFNDWVSRGPQGDPDLSMFLTPERLAQLRATGILNPDNPGAPSSNTLDINAINRLLDKEFLTTTIRNAVVDVGAMFGIGAGQMGGIGAGEGNWRGTPGAGDMPSVAAIAGVQAALEAAGFVPGEYGKALEAYLVSIDQNIVSNPLWKKFTDALHGTAGGAADIQSAMNAAIVATMTPLTFYDAAKAVTDTLTANIKAAMAQQAAMVTAGASQDEIDAVGTLIESMQAGITAYAGLVQLFTSLPGEMAAITGDLEAQTTAAIDAWRVSVQALGDNVQAAQKVFDEALAAGNIVAIQQAAQQLHDVTIAGYNAMLKMREGVEALLKSILDQSANLVQMRTSLAQYEITTGSFAGITRLLADLQGMAERGSTAAQRLWAVDQALQGIIAVLPTAIAQFGSFQRAADWTETQTAGQLQASGPAQITNAVVTGSAPFLAAMQGLIDAAAGPEKLALLQQQASQWNALATAAIAGVRQWAQQAIVGARAAADAAIAGLASVRDAQLAALAAQSEGIQKAARLEQEARQAEMTALSKQIAAARDLEAAIESMGKFILGLKTSPAAPINPRDQLTLAKDAYMAGLATYQAKPTAQGLTNLQGLAQVFLAADEKIYSKPSPHHIALFNVTLEQLEAAKALAAAQASDSEVLQAQLDALQELDKTTTQAAQDQIDAINAQKKSVTDDFETQTKAIEAALKTQVEAIEQAAKDESAIISAGLATALQDNFDKQVPLLQAQFDAANAQLDAIGETRVWQDATRAILQGIYGALAVAIPGAPALASGSDRVTEGLYHLHKNEAVLSEKNANKLRAAGGLSALDTIRSAADGAGLSPGFTWSGPNAAQLNLLEQQARILLEQYQSTVDHNMSWGPGHKIRRNFSDEQLAASKVAMDAQVAAIRTQQQALLDSVPRTPPPVKPGTPTAPTTPPPTSPPPYVSPAAGPGWLNQAAGPTQGAAGSGAGGADGGGALTVELHVDGKVIGKVVMPTVLSEARRGDLHTVIVNTK